MTAVKTSTFYYGFNMKDDEVGGYSEEKCKLRQAINIAIDMEEYIQIFNAGRGKVAQSILPPGIFGYEKGKAGLNAYLFDWDEGMKKPKRKSIEYAKKLLAEAGYPDGRNADGEQLIIYFDNTWVGGGATNLITWFQKQLKKIDIELKIRATDYNRFQEKMHDGNFQMYSWGWNADYPDPENFFFLLYGPNGRADQYGKNSSNYDNPEFDKLFVKMERMDNGPERMGLIRQMNKIISHDAPWVGIWNPVGYGLYHDWIRNTKVHMMSRNTMKYLRIIPGMREKYRKEENQPVFWPIYLFFGFLLIGSLPAMISVHRKRAGRK